MDFIAPAFPLLRVTTLNLDAQFSTLLGRYRLIDKALLSINQNSLETLIARTNQVIQCKTDRVTAREVFNQLVIELREVLKEGDEEKNKQATLFLLGSLIHRYFRILQEYDDYNKLTFWKTSEPGNCKLLQAIRQALQFDTHVKTNFRTSDLKILDVTTIVNALEVFRDNMLLEDVNNKARYKNYPHFASDPHFTLYLEQIINTHKEKGATVLKQFKAIQFIQSLSEKMAIEQEQIQAELDLWCALLAEDILDWHEVTLDQIEEHLEANIESEEVRDKILDLLYTPFINENLAQLTADSFLLNMKKCSQDIASYVVFGGYALLLGSADVHEQLKFCIQQALGIDNDPDALTDQDLLHGIKFLKQFLETNPDVVLDCSFFEGRDKLNTELVQKEWLLSQRVKEEPALSLMTQ